MLTYCTGPPSADVYTHSLVVKHFFPVANDLVQVPLGQEQPDLHSVVHIVIVLPVWPHCLGHGLQS